jgi:hypothetical protein
MSGILVFSDLRAAQVAGFESYGQPYRLNDLTFVQPVRRHGPRGFEQALAEITEN